MSLELNKTQSRLLALLILGALIALVVVLTVMPVWSANRHYSEVISGQEGRLEQLQRSAAIGASLQGRHDQLRRWQASDTQYLKSTSEALAGAELQRVVKRISVAQKAQLLSTQILPSQEEGGFTRVSLKVRIRGTLEQIVRVIHALETSTPFLFLDKVSLRSHGSLRSRLAKGAAVGTLDTDFDLIGYMRASS